MLDWCRHLLSPSKQNLSECLSMCVSLLHIVQSQAAGVVVAGQVVAAAVGVDVVAISFLE